MTGIVFDTEARPSIRTDNYVMWANAGKERIRCQVTNLVFEDHLGDPPAKDIPAVFEANRAAIEDAFRRMIQAGSFTVPADGWSGKEVMLTGDNFARWTAPEAA